MAKDKQRIGISGEFFAASKLTELGYAVGLTRKNTPGIDILVSNGKAAKIVQVKTTETGKPVWVCQKPKIVNDNVVYVFVGLNKDNSPFFHIATSKDVLKNIEHHEEEGRKKYIKKYGREPPQSPRGVPHFIDEDSVYKDKWNLLGLLL